MGNGDGFSYTMRQGDSLAALARQFKLKGWEAIYNHEKNKEYREDHPNPGVSFAGDQVWIPAAKANAAAQPSGKPAKFVGKVTDVAVLSVEFLSGHGLLKRNDRDWTKDGKALPAPEWKGRKVQPISHSCGEPLKLRLHVQVRSKAKDPIAVEFVGEGGKPGFGFRAKADLKPKELDIEVQAAEGLPRMIGTAPSPPIVWKATTPEGDSAAGSTGPHPMYLTYARPIDEGKPEDGVTTRRMETALEWYVKTPQEARTAVDIVEAMFGRFEGYVLGFSFLDEAVQRRLEKDRKEKKRLMKAGFPTYLEASQGGAWPLAEFADYGGECQAIVRLIRGIKNQLGLPGTAEVRYVNAAAPDHFTPIIRDHGSSPSGPEATKAYALVDGEVKVGESYGPDSEVGWNNYEAYMKYSFDPGDGNARVAWFAGGVGKVGEARVNDPDAMAELESSLILVFWGLAEFELVYAKGVVHKKVTRVWRYR